MLSTRPVDSVVAQQSACARCVEIDKYLLRQLRIYGSSLKNILELLKTSKLCFDAVTRHGPSLEYVREPLKTPEMCLTAVAQNVSLHNVPDAIKTSELYLTAVTRDGLNLELVPKPLKTSDLYLATVIQNGESLQFVFDTLKTPELRSIAVE